MKSVAVIPARYESTRFPGKPLLKETGKYLVQHVYERAAEAAGVDRVIVATDDDRILAAVRSFGGECVMTGADHATGSDRVAEVAGQLDCDVVVNVQGDEPEIEPDALSRVISLLADEAFSASTLACPFDALNRQGVVADPHDPGCVKVVRAGRRALYFSRSLIPFARNHEADAPGPLLHLGIYAYRREFLLEMASWEPTPLEKLEGLEQLRILEHGRSIAVGLVERASVGIDTPADYAAFLVRDRSTQRQRMNSIVEA